MNNRFKIIVPVYNATNYIDRCLQSIIYQDYENYKICVIDDCSTDGTFEKIIKIMKEHIELIDIYRNEVHNGSALANIVWVTKLYVADDEDIIVIVDGDDSLANKNVLSCLNEVYQDPTVYMTYGQFVPLSGSYGPFCRLIHNTRTYRKSGEWYASHLRTYKRKLWNKIKDSDLRDKNGDYYKMVGDAAVLYPLIEMCGQKHMRFIDKITYLYNDNSPMNDMKVDKKYNLQLSQEIKISHL